MSAQPLEPLFCKFGIASYWLRGESPIVVPKFKIGTSTKFGTIMKVERGSYHPTSELMTVMYQMHNGRKIAEFDLLDVMRPTGCDYTLGQGVIWQAGLQDTPRRMIVEVIGINPYAWDNSVGVYAVGQGKMGTFSEWISL